MTVTWVIGSFAATCPLSYALRVGVVGIALAT